ncbi:hypothetical protein CDG81_02015 [Actinopolyspora erythraea]|uniref:Cas3 C-terminal domain-containing protein n=1 Tax=Actinopolyspora erythraea TaxID=414996 RepID=A0A099D2N8_9ACTN|nr:hypothetical protein CDG81_02015 [Actinopolyspora erythraea]KGI80226.1 hypothetical protein IL38_18970 [Actinopolyspora erythraea]
MMLLQHDAAGNWFTPEWLSRGTGKLPVPREETPADDLAQVMASCSLRLPLAFSNAEAEEELWQATPKSWEKSPHIYSMPVLLIGQDGWGQITDHPVRYTPGIGLEVHNNATKTKFNLLGKVRVFLRPLCQRAPQLDEGASGRVTYDQVTHGIALRGTVLFPAYAGMNLGNRLRECNTPSAPCELQGWTIGDTRNIQPQRKRPRETQKQAAPVAAGAAFLPQLQPNTKGKSLTSVNVPQTEEKARSERLLISVRVLVILVTSGTVGAYVATVIAIEAWLLQQDELGNIGAVTLAMTIWIAAWALVSLNTAKKLDRIVR